MRLVEGSGHFTHSFSRYVIHDSGVVDRLEMVLKHGLVSPRVAQELSIPYKRDSSIDRGNFRDADNIIYLSPTKAERLLVSDDEYTAVITDKSGDLDVYDYNKMNRYQKGNWRSTREEVYVFGRVGAEMISAIYIPFGSFSRLPEVSALTKRYPRSDCSVAEVRRGDAN